MSTLVQRIIESAKDQNEARSYLRDNYAKDLEKHILQYFPFAAPAGSSEAVRNETLLSNDLCLIFWSGC